MTAVLYSPMTSSGVAFITTPLLFFLKEYPDCGRGYVLFQFFSVHPKRIQAEPCAQLKAGGEGTDPVIAGLLGPEVTQVQKKLFILALQAVCQLLLHFLNPGGKLRSAAVLSVCKGLRIERSEIKLFNDVIHRFSPPLHGAGRP